MQLVDLRVDGLDDPIGSRRDELRFTWRSDGAGPSSRHHRVVVSSHGDLVWDSGWTESASPEATTPAGMIFEAWVEHRWTVTVRTDDGEVSGSGWFVPAPLADADWSDARWIGAPAEPGARDDVRSPRTRATDGALAAPVLARRVESSAPVVRALLALAVGGFADIRVDGALVGDEVLSPSTTHYDRRLQVVVHDLTEQLAGAEGHDLSIELGRGFFGMTNPNEWAWERAPWHAEPCVRAALRLEYDDRTVSTVITDERWTSRRGTILLDDLYGGEVVDLRRADGGPLAAPVRRASVVSGPTGALEARGEQPERVVETLPAASVHRFEDDWIVDFSRVVAGWVRLRLPAGHDGAVVTVRYAERLLDDGRPLTEDANHFTADGFQTDEVTLGASAADWEPRFSYKGFRYARISGWPLEELSSADVSGRVVHNDLARIGAFSVDDPLLQWIHDATVLTIENNLHGYPTDTPLYEKNGWTGDAAVGAGMMLTNLDAGPLLSKWVQDLAETTGEDRPPELTAPNAGIFGVGTVAPPWHSALATVPWEVFLHTGDRRVLERQIDVIERYARFEVARSPDGIADTILGDWVAPETGAGGGNPAEDSRIPATAFLVRILDTTATIQRELGRSSAWAEAAAEQSRRSFRSTFLGRDDRGRSIVTGPGDARYRQSHQVLALAFDLVDDPELRASIAEALDDDVRTRDFHLDTGALGTKWLLPVLTDAGYGATALRVARQTSAPSWGAWRRAGATSTFETWDLDARSHGHYFLGTVDDWLTGWVAGIRPTSPGWRRFAIAPAFTDSIPAASCSVRTPLGDAGVDWRRDGDTVHLRVTVPSGAIGDARLPDGSTRELPAGVHELAVGEGYLSRLKESKKAAR